MKIDVSDISKVNGGSISSVFSESLASSYSSFNEISISEPISFEGIVENVEGLLNLKGILKVNYLAKCSLCLEDVKDSMVININENFELSSENSDGDRYPYKGNYILTDKAFIDNIILHLPVKTMCTQSCKGLCNICGKNLNASECNCEKDMLDPRLSVLKELFKDEV